MAPVPQQDEGGVQLPRVTIDLKVPLWSLVSAAAVVVVGLVGMYYRLDQVGRDVNEMQITMKANNATTIQFAQELALQKFRIEKLEEQKRDRQ